jgi:hypothetical protein
VLFEHVKKLLPNCTSHGTHGYNNKKIVTQSVKTTTGLWLETKGDCVCNMLELAKLKHKNNIEQESLPLCKLQYGM